MLDEYFGLSEKQTSLKIELVAGLTTFLTMAYIVFVNPSILSLEGIEATDIERMDKQALIAVTCLVSGLATIIVGIFARAPIAMAPGMGLNAFFAYLVVSGKMDWRTALGVVFLSGLFFLILTLLGLRKRLVEAIPESLVSAIAVGIGLFITFMGLVKLGIVVSDEHTLVKAGPLNAPVLIGLFGLLAMIFCEMKKIRGGLVAGILVSTLLAGLFGMIDMPDRFVSLEMNLPAVSLRLDILGALKWSFFGSIFTLMFIDMFDSVGTLVACCHQAGMVDKENRIEGLDRLLGIDAVATMIGALFGTSTTTAYMESAAGIEQGGRTGLTAVVTGILFLLTVIFVPVVGIVPGYATAPALIMVGLFMMKEVKKIDFANMEEAFPAFIIMVMIALSYSISTGLAFGFVSFALIKTVSGKVREVKPAMWIIAGLSVLFLALDQIPGMIERLRSLI
ncbi:MAG: NCS2 family permease [Planctomycetota bacterium]|jgi:AGZA family xanthine/uracil permease-like MFS transporter